MSDPQTFLAERVTQKSSVFVFDACLSLLAVLHPTRTRKQLACELGAGSALALSASYQGKVHGLLIATSGVESFELTDLIVRASSRRLGVASFLLSSLFYEARSIRKEAVYLEVRRSNEGALRLYQKHGFVRVGVRSSYYAEPAEDALVFRSELGATAG